MVAQARRLKAPIAYFGGKQDLAEFIISLMPPHACYVEAFGGAGGVLFQKRPSPVEVWNDLDSGLVAFFRVLREPKMAKRLQRLLELTPYSREEWAECCVSWRIASDEVEMARRWFVATQQAFGAHLADAGWRFSEDYGYNPAAAFRNRTSLLANFCQRMALVQVEHDDFEAIMTRYDSPRTLFYLDPPYVGTTRKMQGARYLHEMRIEDHERLLMAAQRLEGMAMISGYDCDLYNEALTGWTKVMRAARNRMARKQTGERTECLWISPNATRRQLTLFD